MSYSIACNAGSSKGKLTPPGMQLAVKKKGRQPLGFKEYGSNETHPSKTFNAALKELGANIERPSSAPLDFQAGDLPRGIPVLHTRKHHDPVAALHEVGTPEASLRAWYATPTSKASVCTSSSQSFSATTLSTTPPTSYKASSPALTYSYSASSLATPTSPISDFALEDPTVNINYFEDDNKIGDDDDALSIQSAPDRSETAAFKTDIQKRFEANVFAMGSAVHLTFPTTGKGYENLKYAQSIYTPNACLLVGNLPSSIPDEILSMTVQHEFSAYGRCFACVFRGKGLKGYHRPYAIVQFTHVRNASYAFFKAQDLEIWGRSVRVERSNRRSS